MRRRHGPVTLVGAYNFGKPVTLIDGDRIDAELPDGKVVTITTAATVDRWQRRAWPWWQRLLLWPVRS
jgi:hypothetical protein